MTTANQNRTIEVATPKDALYAIMYITASQPARPPVVKYRGEVIEPSDMLPWTGVHVRAGNDDATLATLYVDGEAEAHETFPNTWCMIAPVFA